MFLIKFVALFFFPSSSSLSLSFKYIVSWLSNSSNTSPANWSNLSSSFFFLLIIVLNILFAFNIAFNLFANLENFFFLNHHQLFLLILP
jgi:hypothetical protein